MRVVVQPALGTSGSSGGGGAHPKSTRRRRRLLAVVQALAALLLVALLLPRSLGGGGRPEAKGAAVVAGHGCPQYGGSILDLPDTGDCRRLLRVLAPCLPHQGQAMVSDTPGADCCKAAAAFFVLQCHCWSSQFDAAAVLGVAAVDDVCARAAQRQAAGGADDITLQAAREGTEASAASSGSSGGGVAQLSRLREQQGGGGQQAQRAQPIFLRTHDGATREGAAGGAAAGDGGAGSIRLYVGVLSAGARREARDAVRATWGAHPAAYRRRFFLARPANDTLFEEIRAEAVEKRDMVVLGHIAEHYLNISHQTLEIFRFAAADPAVTHVLKVDDDSYVHWDRLTHRLAMLSRERLFWGRIENPGGHPQRDPRNQWYVSQEEWPSERYPPWAHGAGYVLSADLAAELAPGTAFAASEGGHLFKLEDVALGSWLEWTAARRGFTLHLVPDKRFNFEGCSFGDLVSHYIRPVQMRCMWGQGGFCKGC